MNADGDIPPERSLSVVIPNYNHAAFVGRAVTSHLDQHLPPLEIIVVDDCSTDNSVEVISALAEAHPEVQLVRHDERGGPNAGISTGLGLARGEYVRFAAADDFVGRGLISGAVASLRAHPGAAFCFSDPSGYEEATGRFQHIPLALSETPCHFTPDELVALFQRNYFTISSNTVIYRTDAIAPIGGFPTDLEWQADWFVNLVLALRHGVCYRPETNAHFVLNPKSYGSRGVRSASGQKRLLFACLDALSGPYEDVEARFRAAGLVPETSLRTLFWLLSDPRGQDFLTPLLAKRLIAREAWSAVRSLVPHSLRRWMHRVAAG